MHHDDVAEAQAILEWYRPNPMRAMARVWAFGVGLLFSGLAVVAVSLHHGLISEGPMRSGLLSLGFLLTALAPVTFIIRMRPIMAERACIVVRRDGLLLSTQAQTEDVYTRWDELEEITWRPDTGTLRFETTEASVIEMPARFLEITGPDLRARLCDLQRRALMGLL